MVFNANEPIRGSPRTRIDPNAGELTLATGLTLASSLDQFGWLRMLKYSARNCIPTRSVIWKFLTRPISQLKAPGQRNCPLLVVPKVNAAGRVNPWLFGTRRSTQH